VLPNASISTPRATGASIPAPDGMNCAGTTFSRADGQAPAVANLPRAAAWSQPIVGRAKGAFAPVKRLASAAPTASCSRPDTREAASLPRNYGRVPGRTSDARIDDQTDNQEIARSAGSVTEVWFTVWTRLEEKMGGNGPL